MFSVKGKASWVVGFCLTFSMALNLKTLLGLMCYFVKFC